MLLFYLPGNIPEGVFHPVSELCQKSYQQSTPGLQRAGCFCIEGRHPLQYGQTTKAYAFSYDGAHRLSDGQFYSNGTSTNTLSEKGISYDRAGNITALTRYDNSSLPVATSLSYACTGNRRNGYSYDVNGNVTSDATNDLQSSYNLLNLPAKIKSGSKQFFCA